MSAQPWICGSCRSLNQPREGRCYRCRTPRELVEADPETLLVAGAGSKPVDIVRPVGQFRSSGDRAFAAQVLIGAALAVTVVANVLGADLVARVVDGLPVQSGFSPLVVSLIGLLGLGLGAAALVAWALWLSGVVANVPTLGLGWPNVTPNQAVIESIVPGVNLYRVPAVLRDVMNRLEPGGRAEGLIAAAWLALVGGVLLPRLATWVLVFLIGPLDDFVPLRIVVGQLALGLTVAGGVILIVLIRWIEIRMERIAAGSPVPPEPVAAG